MQLFHLLPTEALKIVLVLFLSFLVGLEREEHKSNGKYSFGGVRTFPLIGLDWLLHRPDRRPAIDAARHRLCCCRWIFAALLLAQTRS